jgi:hypothetical protein
LIDLECISKRLELGITLFRTFSYLIFFILYFFVGLNGKREKFVLMDVDIFQLIVFNTNKADLDYVYIWYGDIEENGRNLKC